MSEEHWATGDGRARAAGFWHRERSTSLFGGPGGVHRMLAARTTPLMRLTGWILATAIFATSLFVWYAIGHGATGPVSPNGDSQESAVPAIAIEHGAWACAYPASNRSSVPPLYPLISGGVLAATGSSFVVGPWIRTTSACPSLGDRGLGPRYPEWSFLLTGLLAWPVLLVGFVLLLEVSGRGHTRYELLGVWLVGALPGIASAYVDEFHPEDLFALGFVLLALALAVRHRWTGAGACIGLALCSKQYAVLAAVPLFLCVPSSARLRYTAGALGAAAVILVPFGLLMGKGMLVTLVGSYATSTDGATLVGQLHLHGVPLVVLSRVLPLALAALVAALARSRLGDAVCRPVPLTAVVAVAFVLRLLFEINLYSYYFIASAVVLVALDVVAGRVRAATITWLVVTAVLYPPVYETLVPLQEHAPLVAQAADLVAAMALALTPLLALLTRGRAVGRVPRVAAIET